MYDTKFEPTWCNYFDKLDNSIKERVAKTIKKIKDYPNKRHMKGKAKFFVEEFGQNKYRIIYRVFEDIKQVRFYFVGNHKDYEEFYKRFF